MASLRSPSSQENSFIKAFQNQTKFDFDFFNTYPLNQASLFRDFVLKKPITFVIGFAERKGFEPPIRCRIHAFQACSLNHSDTSLYGLQIYKKLEFMKE